MLLAFPLSCSLISNPGNTPESGDRAPSSFTQKVLIEVASSAGSDECQAGDVQLERLTGYGTDSIAEYRDVVYAVTFHVYDNLDLNITSKSSGLLEYYTTYIENVLKQLPVPKSAINCQSIPYAQYERFLSCDGWEEAVGNIVPLSAAEWKTTCGLRMETDINGSFVVVAVFAGFAQKPTEELYVTVILLEDGVECFVKGEGITVNDWVVRGLMRDPEDNICSFGYPILTAVLKAGDIVKIPFSLSLDEINFEAIEDLKAVAVLHKEWTSDLPDLPDNGAVPGTILNVQQVNLGEDKDWD